MTAITPALVKEHGLTKDEYAHIKRLLNREPSFVEYLRIDSGGTPPKAENMKTAEVQLGYRTDKQLSTLTLFSNRYDNYIERDNTGAIGNQVSGLIRRCPAVRQYF